MPENIEKIYREHIASLPISEQLKLIEKVAQQLAVRNDEPQKTRSIMELHGLGAEIWQGVDAQEYVNKLRDEWSHRP